MKLNKEKCNVLPLARNNSRHQYMLEAEQLGNTSAEKDFEILVDNKLSMSQQCTLMAK